MVIIPLSICLLTETGVNWNKMEQNWAMWTLLAQRHCVVTEYSVTHSFGGLVRHRVASYHLWGRKIATWMHMEIFDWVKS